MENELATTTKDLFKQTNIKQRFEELLGEKAPGFISSVLQVVGNNKLLVKAKPETILNAAVTAAILDLPINQNLGFAWIVPYGNEAQFQMGYKGYVQLALRTNQYKNINVCEVCENQFNSFNVLTEELDADFTIEGEGEIAGYVAFFKLLSGFEKTVYWSKIRVDNHAKKYSKAYGSSHSPWNDKDQYGSMAMKTVLKHLISRWGIMSIEMSQAISADQSVQRKEGSYDYPDNDNTIDLENDNKEEADKRVLSFIEKAKSLDDLEKIEEFVNEETQEQFDSKKSFLILD